MRTFEVFSIGEVPLGQDKHVCRAVFTIINPTDTSILLVWVSKTPLGPQRLCLMPGETRFSRDGMVLPILEQQGSEEDQQLCPKLSSFPFKNPETRRLNY